MQRGQRQLVHDGLLLCCALHGFQTTPVSGLKPLEGTSTRLPASPHVHDAYQPKLCNHRGNHLAERTAARPASVRRLPPPLSALGRVHSSLHAVGRCLARCACTAAQAEFCRAASGARGGTVHATARLSPPGACVSGADGEDPHAACRDGSGGHPGQRGRLMGRREIRRRGNAPAAGGQVCMPSPRVPLPACRMPHDA